MSDIASPAHADLRSASRSYNRDKNHTSKWSLGPRTTLNQPVLDSAWTANKPATSNIKIVPQKWSRGPSKPHNSHKPSLPLPHSKIESANLRVTRKQDTLHEITSPDSKTLSRSLADLLPSTATSIPIKRNSDAEAGVLYSFDRKMSPSDQVGLGGLIERAEERWKEKETVRLVRREWEVLDGEGERESGGKGGRRGKRGSARSEGGVGGIGGSGVMIDDEDDYELV